MDRGESGSEGGKQGKGGRLHLAKGPLTDERRRGSTARGVVAALDEEEWPEGGRYEGGGEKDGRRGEAYECEAFSGMVRR